MNLFLTADQVSWPKLTKKEAQDSPRQRVADESRQRKTARGEPHASREARHHTQARRPSSQKINQSSN